MSHFTMLVVLPEYSEESLRKALQPYHEYECDGVMDEYVRFVKADESEEELLDNYKRNKDDYSSYANFLDCYYGYEIKDGIVGRYTNPDRKWDWYQVGGRWCGHFDMKVLPHTDMNSFKAKIKGYEKGEQSLISPSTSNGYDIIKKKDIDLKSEFNKKYDLFMEAFYLYKNIAANHSYIKWADIVKDDIRIARQQYHSQPILKELDKAFKNFPHDMFVYHHYPENFCFGNQEKFINAIKYQTYGTYGILMDGKWMSKGDMGWWGCDRNVDEDWPTKWFEIFDSIPDESWCVVVDCHI